MSGETEQAIGISTLPNQKHKIVSRKGAKFTLMVLGESGSGKTTFINTLFSTLLKEPKNIEERHNQKSSKTTEIEVLRYAIDEKGFNLELSVIDTPGFADNVNNSDCWLPIMQFLDKQHEDYLSFESKAERQNHIDLRVHACLYFIQPTGHTLKPLDVQVMKLLSERANLIPIIAKADTMTPAAMLSFKKAVRDCIAANNIAIFSPPNEEDSSDSFEYPYSVIGSLEQIIVDGLPVRGRQYAWGAALVENDEHCDFKKLRSLLIRTHMYDLIQSTEDFHYENYRTKKMVSLGRSDDDPQLRARKALDVRMKEEEAQLRRKFTDEVRKEEQRFRMWEQKLISERDRLNKDLENEHKALKLLQEDFEKLLAARKQ